MHVLFYSEEYREIKLQIGKKVESLFQRQMDKLVFKLVLYNILLV